MRDELPSSILFAVKITVDRQAGSVNVIEVPRIGIIKFRFFSK